MNAKDIIRNSVESCHMIARAYVDDLSDEALLVRPVPGCNHIAWQLGHLISGTHKMLTWIGQTPPALPQGFAERYTKDTAALDDAAAFHKKSEYQALADQMKVATLAAIEATPADQLDQPAPESMRGYAPTISSVLMLLGMHWLMHAGQFVPVRRKLGMPAMF